MNWKISSFLPDIVGENFKTLIAGYLGSINESLKELHSKKDDTQSQQIDTLNTSDKGYIKKL